MKHIKISGLDDVSIKPLLESEEEITLDVAVQGISKESLELLNYLLSQRGDFWIDINADTSHTRGDIVSGLDIIAFIPNAKNIRLQASIVEPLVSLEVFSNVEDIRKLRVYGNIQRGILLEPLSKFENLEVLQLENGLSLRQHVFISTCKKLYEVDVAEFNASSFDKNTTIKNLLLSVNLLGIDSLPRALPSLEVLSLEGCRQVSYFTPLKDMPTLRDLTFKNISRLKCLPEFKTLDNLNKIAMHNLPDLNDIKNLFTIPNLKSLVMTDVCNLKMASFKELAEMESLESVSISFKDTRENKLMADFIKKNKWLTAL